MDRSSNFKSNLVIAFFFVQVIVNWLYCAWVDELPGILINSWFVVMPLIGYFYFTFALIALVGMYQRKRYGLNLAYAVLLVGSMVSVLSYHVIYRKHFLLEQLIIPLLAVNLCVIIYMLRNQSYFKGA